MRPYEVMIVFDPTLEESVLQEQVDRCSEIVRSRGATVGRVERWGRRRLAYELQHHRDGYYVVMEATSEPAAIAELDRSLHLADEVLRHKVIRIPDRVAERPRQSVPAAESAGPAPVVESAGPAPVVGSGETVAADEAAGDTSISANGA